jgi:hypothetical protein
MQTITRNRIVQYTFRRDGKLYTRPAIVTDVGEANKDMNPNPASPRGRRLEPQPCVSLTVFDVGFAGGSIGVSQVFEDKLDTPDEDGNARTEPMLGCWAWPTATQAPLNELAAAVAAGDPVVRASDIQALAVEMRKELDEAVKERVGKALAAAATKRKR